jgi:hypothetical protein
MTEKAWKTKIQIIVAKMAMGIRITIDEKKFLLRYRAHEVINRDRLKRAA